MAEHTIRARYTDQTIRVYQAYGVEIARPALKAGRFVPPFKIGRMTWIKPSFNWMMYRSGYGTKSGQEVVLGIDVTREGFAWALEHAASSRFNPVSHGSPEEWRRLVEEMPVRIQWDPERNFRLGLVGDLRTIQIGLSGEAVERYVNQWIVRIEDVTPLARQIAATVARGEIPEELPDRLEATYPLDPELTRRVCHE